MAENSTASTEITMEYDPRSIDEQVAEAGEVEEETQMEPGPAMEPEPEPNDDLDHELALEDGHLTKRPRTTGPHQPWSAALRTASWVHLQDSDEFVSPLGTLKTPDGKFTNEPFPGGLLALVAPCGRGKSTVFQQYLHKNPQSSALLLSANIAYGEFLSAELKTAFGRDNVAFYKNDNSNHQDSSRTGVGPVDKSKILMTRRIVVCSLESLHQLETRTFDIVVLDELRSLAKLPGGGTMTHGLDNVYLLQRICQAARSVLCCDADLMLQYPSEPAALGAQFLNFLAPERTVVCQTVSGRGPAHLRRQARLFYAYKTARNNEAAWLAEVDTAADAWLEDPENRFAVCVGSKAQVNEIFGRMKSKGVPCKPYSGDTKNEKYEDFRNVKQAWAPFGCIVFTTTLKVGVDVKMEFARVFWRTHRRGCTLVDQGQAVMRFRYVRNPVIDILIDCIPPRTRAELVQAGKKKPLQLPMYDDLRGQVEKKHAGMWLALTLEARSNGHSALPSDCRQPCSVANLLLDVMAHAALPNGGLERKLQEVDPDGVVRHLLRHYDWVVDESAPSNQGATGNRGDWDVDADDNFVHGMSQTDKCQWLLDFVAETGEEEFFHECGGLTEKDEAELTGMEKFRLEIYFLLKDLKRFPRDENGVSEASMLAAFAKPKIVDGLTLQARLRCFTVEQQTAIDRHARIHTDTKIVDALTMSTTATKMRTAHEIGALLELPCLWEDWALESDAVIVIHIADEQRCKKTPDAIGEETIAFKHRLRALTSLLLMEPPKGSILEMLKQIAISIGMKCSVETCKPRQEDGSRPTLAKRIEFTREFPAEVDDWLIYSDDLKDKILVKEWNYKHADLLIEKIHEQIDPELDAEEPYTGDSSARQEFLNRKVFDRELARLHSRRNPNAREKRWRDWLTAAERVTIKQDDFLLLPVTYGKKRRIGRRTASYPSLQHCPSPLRKLLCAGIYHDADISNCHPTLMLQVATGSSVPHDQIPILVELAGSGSYQREGVYKSIMDYYGVQREDAKDAVLRVLNGGGIDAWLKDTEKRRTKPMPARPDRHLRELEATEMPLVQNAFFQQYAENAKQLGSEIRTERAARVAAARTQLAAANTPTARAAAKQQLDDALYKASPSAIKRTVFSLCIFELEDTILGCIDLHFQSLGLKVDALIFDGVLVQHSDNVNLERAMRSAEAAVQEKLGYTIALAEKDMYAAHSTSLPSLLPDQAVASGGVAPVAATTGPPAFCLLVSSDGLRVLLTRERRRGESRYGVLGGSHEPGESPSQTAAREAWEETGKQLSSETTNAIQGLAGGARCRFTQGTVFAARLASGSPDDTVDQRFNAAAANRRGSQTYQEGVEWVGVSELRDHHWRDLNMHKHAAAAAATGLGLMTALLAA